MTANYHCQGRGLHSPVITVEPFGDRVQLRIDCDQNPDFWLELVLEHRELIALLRSIVNVQREAQDAGHDILDELEINLGIETK